MDWSRWITWRQAYQYGWERRRAITTYVGADGDRYHAEAPLHLLPLTVQRLEGEGCIVASYASLAGPSGLYRVSLDVEQDGNDIWGPRWKETKHAHTPRSQ